MGPSMKNLCLSILIILFLSGCNLDEAHAIKDNASNKKVWVFIQFNIPLKNDELEDYYYYGKVSQPLYERIKTNKIKAGFILLDDVKYWGKDNLIYDYADGENEGELVFRIEDIRKMELVRKKPIAGKGREQFEAIKTDIEKKVKKFPN
jgi:hypothetical protein